MHFRSHHELQGGLGALSSTKRSHVDNITGLGRHSAGKALSSMPPSTQLPKNTQNVALVESSSPLRIPLRTSHHDNAPPMVALQRPQDSFRRQAAKRVSYTTDERIDLDELSNSDASEAEKEQTEGSMEVADILFQMSRAKPEKVESESRKRKADTPLTTEFAPRSSEEFQEQQSLPHPSSQGLLSASNQMQQQIQASNILTFLAKKRRLVEPSNALAAARVSYNQAAAAAAARLHAASYLDSSTLRLSQAYALANSPQMAPTASTAGLLQQQQVQANLQALRESQGRLLTTKKTQQVQVPRSIPGLSSYDVLFGRSLASHLNVGNRRALVLIAAHLPQFTSTKKDDRKQELVDSVYDAIRQGGGRFVFLSEDISIAVYSEIDAKLRIKGLFARVQFVQSRLGDGLENLFSEGTAMIWNDKLPKKAAPAATRRSVMPGAGIVPSSASVALPVHPRSTSPPVESGRRSSKRIEPMTPLAPGFRPGPFDVICSRGSAAKKHAGNVYFVALIEKNCDRYTKTTCKLAKSMIVSEMLDTVRRNSPHGGFVKQNDDGVWCETGDHLAREKIGQCFRDRLHTLYSSSSKAKLEKRRLKFIASGRKKWARQPKPAPEQHSSSDSEQVASLVEQPQEAYPTAAQ